MTSYIDLASLLHGLVDDRRLLQVCGFHDLLGGHHGDDVAIGERPAVPDTLREDPVQGTQDLLDGMLVGNAEITVAVAATVSISILFIVMFAKVVGSLLPIAAEKIGVDPAVMANPLISTLTDAVSLLIYIHIAKIILHI